MGTFANELRQYNDLWAKGKDGVAQLPEGTFQAQLLSASVHKSESSQKLSLKRTHTFLTGEPAGKEYTDYVSFATENGVAQVAEWLNLFGHTPPDDLGDVEDIIQTISSQQPVVEIKVRHGQQAGSVFLSVVRVVDEGVAPEPAPAASAARRPSKPAAPAAPEPADDADAAALAVDDAVTFVFDNQTVEGTISKINEDGTYNVMTEEGEYENLDPTENQIEAADAGDDGAEGAEGADDPETLKTLTGVAVTFGCEGVKDGMTVAEVVDVLKGYTFVDGPGAGDDAVAPNEAELLREYGITVNNVPAKAAAAKKPAAKPTAPAKPSKPAAPAKAGARKPAGKR